MDLRRLRKTVERLSTPSTTVPFAALLEAAKSTAGARVTIDFTAVEALGFPLVVVREQPRPSFVDDLTPRERAVAQQLARGRCNKDIARALGISLGTVKDHVHAVLRKSGLSSRLEVASAFISSTS
jgi:DNA-binding NarL/FixJ family response regulator